MHLLPFLFLCAAAALAFLAWYNQTPPRRLASIPLSLFLFIVGMTLVFVLEGHPMLHFVTNN